MIYTKETIKELPIHVSLLPPCIANFPTGRKAVFTMEGPTIDIADDVTLDDVRSRWKRWQPTGNQPVTQKDVKHWSVQGKKSKYTVTFMNGQYSCSCPGYGFRRRCKHIEEIKSRYNE